MGKDYVVDFRNIHPTVDELNAIKDFSDSEKNVLDILYKLSPRSDFSIVEPYIKAVAKSVSANVLKKNSTHLTLN